MFNSGLVAEGALILVTTRETRKTEKKKKYHTKLTAKYCLFTNSKKQLQAQVLNNGKEK